MNPLWGKESVIPLMNHDPSDVVSLIQFRIIQKKRTPQRDRTSFMVSFSTCYDEIRAVDTYNDYNFTVCQIGKTK